MIDTLCSKCKRFSSSVRKGGRKLKINWKFFRKAAGSSSLDFEKAMSYTSQINEEKEHLEKANHAIQEIEQKIRELQAKIK